MEQKEQKETKTKREVLLERHQSWKKPEPKENSYRTGLHVANNLWPIDNVEFIPVHGRKVNFYGCGPTVYSDTHIGHARCYIVSDMIRRVLRDYFRYDVNYVMNITDIDDKIIDRSDELKVDFLSFARKWEADFFENMKSIGVEPPTRLVRVTEYVPEVVKFIEHIISNGYAYSANGSVYFNVEEFIKNGHHYCKLEPTSYNPSNKDLELNKDKKSSSDFALWKKVKEGEPSWPSPWGPGRPGWHIECSAMIHEAFAGEKVIDIHYGGQDLKFPHHDNEIAQSEAFYKNKQWINYFLHCGQLYNKGKKMSKSEKNYSTVKEILQVYTARQLRMLCLIHSYDSLLNYEAETSFVEPSEKDHSFHQFNLSAQVHLRKGFVLEGTQRFDHEEESFENQLHKAKEAIHGAFCNNFDTPKVIEELLVLVRNMNIYFKRPAERVKSAIVMNHHKYIFETLAILGFDYTTESVTGKDEEKLYGVVQALCEFRDSVLQAAGKEPKAIFDLGDKLRDEVLPNHGIKIEDAGKGKPSTWKMQDKDSLLKEIQSKKLEILRAKEEKEKKAKEAEEKAKRHPREIFNDADYKKFSIAQFDDKGIPTHNAKGEPFPPKVRAAFEKDYAKQEKIREEWFKKNPDSKDTSTTPKTEKPEEKTPAEPTQAPEQEKPAA
jgi:cysteinyl-tRNA synthetase